MGNQCCCLIISVPENHVHVMHRLGKFDGLLRPGSGITFINCFTQGIQKTLSLQLRTLYVTVVTKTKDHTFMEVGIELQYRAVGDDESVYNAVYKLKSPLKQMSAYIEDVIRTSMNKLTLDEAYRAKNEISDKVKEELSTVMSKFGYEIVSAPITKLDPNDPAVLREMNRVLELEKALEAQDEVNQQIMNEVLYRAEAEKVAFIESGKGLAAKRTAIVDGLRESVSTFSKGVDGVTSRDVLELILVTQYFDMLKDIGSKGKNTLFIKHGPTAVPEITQDIRKGFEVANRK